MTEYHSPFAISNKRSAGQVMLISVLIMGGMMGIAMAVSLLFLQEIRLARQTPESVKAIYAADAGVECGLYQYFVNHVNCAVNPVCSSAGDPFGNGATYETNIVDCGVSATTTVSIGASQNVQRALSAGPLP